MAPAARDEQPRHRIAAVQHRDNQWRRTVPGTRINVRRIAKQSLDLRLVTPLHCIVQRSRLRASRDVQPGAHSRHNES
jgi:hypothetical protein